MPDIAPGLPRPVRRWPLKIQRPGAQVMSPGAKSADILNSWKEIAAYLQRGVRTAQRWEANRGLPVRRPNGKLRNAVIALRSEIDDWIRSAPVISKVATGKRTDVVKLSQAVNAIGRQFLMTEMGCAVTFISVARYAQRDENERFVRNVRNARKAYSTILKFRDRVAMDEAQQEQLNAGLKQIENALEELERGVHSRDVRSQNPSDRSPSQNQISPS